MNEVPLDFLWPSSVAGPWTRPWRRSWAAWCGPPCAHPAPSSCLRWNYTRSGIFGHLVYINCSSRVFSKDTVLYKHRCFTFIMIFTVWLLLDWFSLDFLLKVSGFLATLSSGSVCDCATTENCETLGHLSLYPAIGHFLRPGRQIVPLTGVTASHWMTGDGPGISLVDDLKGGQIYMTVKYWDYSEEMHDNKSKYILMGHFLI